MLDWLPDRSSPAMSRHQYGKHHRIRDRLAETDFEIRASQFRGALTLGGAIAGCDLESAGNAGALGSFNIICLVADQP